MSLENNIEGIDDIMISLCEIIDKFARVPSYTARFFYDDLRNRLIHEIGCLRVIDIPRLKKIIEAHPDGREMQLRDIL
jgi:hypothetical protein